ncbi:MAG: hypothetical protein L0Z62_25235 [Gemmataceae bacterium]|nr:hypothetical protein [Gemmataceae bacterium]
MLRNKHDLWSGCPAAQLGKLIAWFEAQVQRLQHRMPPGAVSAADHSNERTNDIDQARQRILEIAARLAQK